MTQANPLTRWQRFKRWLRYTFCHSCEEFGHTWETCRWYALKKSDGYRTVAEEYLVTLQRCKYCHCKSDKETWKWEYLTSWHGIELPSDMMRQFERDGYVFR